MGHAIGDVLGLAARVDAALTVTFLGVCRQMGMR
jgi:hypothetical protein